MTFLLWLYQFIGAMFLGFMICTASDADAKFREWPLTKEWPIILLLAIVWPYAFYLIYRQEVKT